MKIVNKNKNKQKGFTLIELLLAMFLFSIAITAIFSSFSAVITSSKKVKQSVKDIETARHCFDMLSKDLNNLFIPTSFKVKNIDKSKESPYAFIGSSDSFSFPAFSHIMFADELVEIQRLDEEMAALKEELEYFDDENSSEYRKVLQNKKNRYESNLALISYSLISNNSDTYSLKRSDILFNEDGRPVQEFAGGENSYSVCSNIRSMEIIYEDDEGTQSTSWDSASQTESSLVPTLVSISLKLQGVSSINTFRTKIALPVKNLKEKKK